MKQELAVNPIRQFIFKGAVTLVLMAVVVGCDSQRGGVSNQATLDQTKGPERIILIILDALRTDRVSYNGYSRETTPNIDRFANQSAVFLNHYVQGTNTRESLPTLFYSRYFISPIIPYAVDVPFMMPDGGAILSDLMIYGFCYVMQDHP